MQGISASVLHAERYILHDSSRFCVHGTHGARPHSPVGPLAPIASTKVWHTATSVTSCLTVSSNLQADPSASIVLEHHGAQPQLSDH